MTSSAVDGPSGRMDTVPVRLRVDVYDRLIEAKGLTGVAAQARLHRLSPAQMWNLRAGRSVPKLDTAMRMADDLGVAVEVIWERVPEPTVAGTA